MNSCLGEVVLSYKRNPQFSFEFRINNSQDVVDFFFQIEDFVNAVEHHEIAYLLLLSNRSKVLGYYKLGEGGINFCPVDVRTAMQAALLSNTSRVIFVHNHPSGDAVASNEDLSLKEKFIIACKYLNIEFLDSIIITPNKEHKSF